MSQQQERPLLCQKVRRAWMWRNRGSALEYERLHAMRAVRVQQHHTTKHIAVLGLRSNGIKPLAGVGVYVAGPGVPLSRECEGSLRGL